MGRPEGMIISAITTAITVISPANARLDDDQFAVEKEGMLGENDGDAGRDRTWPGGAAGVVPSREPPQWWQNTAPGRIGEPHRRQYRGSFAGDCGGGVEGMAGAGRVRAAGAAENGPSAASNRSRSAVRCDIPTAVGNEMDILRTWPPVPRTERAMAGSPVSCVRRVPSTILLRSME